MGSDFQTPACKFSCPRLTPCFSQLSRMRRLAKSADPLGSNQAAKDIEGDARVEVAPLLRPLQFGDMPWPHLVGSGGDQFRLGIMRIPPLLTPLSYFVLFGEDTIHGARRAEITPLIQEFGLCRLWGLSTNRSESGFPGVLNTERACVAGRGRT